MGPATRGQQGQADAAPLPAAPGTPGPSSRPIIPPPGNRHACARRVAAQLRRQATWRWALRTCTHLEALDLAIAADGVDSLALLQRTLLLLELREPLRQAALALGLVALLLPEARVFLPLLEQDVVPRLVLPHHCRSHGARLINLNI